MEQNFFLSDEKLIEGIKKITGFDYSNKKLELEDIAEIIDNLIYEYHNLEEEMEEKEEHCKEYHTEKYIDPYGLYGVSERDFH